MPVTALSVAPSRIVLTTQPSVTVLWHHGSAQAIARVP